MPERLVARVGRYHGSKVDLLAIDITDPRIHASTPYVLRRTGMLSGGVPLCDLARADLEALYDAIGRELGREGDDA